MKSPAFQLYTNDLLASTKVAMLSVEQFGAYMLLLCHAWNADDCGLPNDDNALALLSRLASKWHDIGRPMADACFVARNGRLYNERLLQEREKQNAWREKSEKGAKARWGTKSDAKAMPSLCQTDAKAMPNTIANACSSSTSSSSNIETSTNVDVFPETEQSVSRTPPPPLNGTSHELPYVPSETLASPDDTTAPPKTPQRPAQTARCAPVGTQGTPFLTFPCDGPVKAWELTQEMLQEYQATYETVNVRAEMLKARQWILASPERKKTANGMPRFVVGWLNKACNQSRGPSKPERPAYEAEQAAAAAEWSIDS